MPTAVLATLTAPETFLLVRPEITLVAGAILAFLTGAFAGMRRGWLVAAATIVVALVVAWNLPGAGMAIDAAGRASIVSGPVVIDAFSTYVRWTVLGLGLLLALVQAGDLIPAAVSRGAAAWRGGTCEEAGTFLLLLAGLSVVGVANDLVLLFAGLELVSIPTYILLALRRTDAHGQEASLKYFFLSLVASSLFLYALVCLYGIGGSTSLVTISNALRAAGDHSSAIVLLPAALGMALAGAAFRLAAVPMHFYAPDVYEGTSPGNAALLSTLPKVAGVVLLLRLLALAIPGPLGDGTAGAGAAAFTGLFWQLSAVLAALTMTVGNVMALVQTNLRRLLACSSIAHAGYLLVGVAVAGAAASAGTAAGRDALATDASWLAGLGGATATLFYLATYSLATIGLFAAISYLGHRWPEWSTGNGPHPPRHEIATIDDLDGLSGTNPVAAFAIAVFLLSLAGIPPLPGFWGKLTLATTALEVDWNGPTTFVSRRAAFVALAVILVLNAAIAAAYYLRIISAMYFRSTKRGVQADGGLAAGVAMLVCLVLVCLVTLQPRGLFRAASAAGGAVSRTPVVASAQAAMP